MFIRGFRILTLIMLMGSLLTLIGCNNDPLDVNVSDIKVELEIKRLDQDMFNLNPSAGQTDIAFLEKKYGQFLTDYSEGVLRIGNPRSPSFQYSVAQFITDESMLTLYKDVQSQYADIDDINQDLTDAFRYFKYHFPDSAVPTIVYNISALNYAVVATENTLAIGLDMFLGADYPVYPVVGLPKYMFYNMKKEQIVPQAMKGWIQSMFEEQSKRSTLLEHIVFEGKLLYALDAVLRNSADSTKIGFSSSSMSWCHQYESRIWAHLIEAQLLYTTDHMDINKWINQAPFIAGIPKQSPGRLGQWVGWQLVRKYMFENPEITIEQLMLNNEAQEILALSKYKPK